MKARKHRGGFAESMDTMQEIPPTKLAVSRYFNVPMRYLRIEPHGFDIRAGWQSDTFLVSDRNGVLGMINEEPKK